MSQGALQTIDATSPARPESEVAATGSRACEPSEDMLAPGARAGDFVVEAVLGHGSFGSVYRAAHHLIGRRAAVKVLRASVADARAIASFVEEARLVSRLRHPHIVDVLTFGQLDDGRHFQVMDLIVGPTLADFLKERGALDLEIALPILRGIASALDVVHRSSVAHRDLKPANVVLEERDGAMIPKLIDFGIAELISREPTEDVDARALVGTPRYMAPEQCRGKRVDARADSYAFGLLAYEMLTGGPPFSGEDALELMLKHTSESPDPPSKRHASVPRGADAIVLSLLEKEPEDRPVELMPIVRQLEAVIEAPTSSTSARTRWWPIPIAVGVAATVAVVLLTMAHQDEPREERATAVAPDPEVAPASGTSSRPAVPIVAVPTETSASPVQTAHVPAVSPVATSAPASVGDGKSTRRSTSAEPPGPEDPENPFRRR